VLYFNLAYLFIYVTKSCDFVNQDENSSFASASAVFV